MDRWQYLLLMAGCLLTTLPLEFVLGARVYRSPRRLWRALWPMLVMFVAWDLIVIPICGLLSLEAVRRILGLLAARRSKDA